MTDLAMSLAVVRASDAAEFERLVRSYERQVLVTALRLLGNITDAQDASQEVFLRLYRNLRRLDDPSECAPWLYRVTVNVCRDLARKRHTVSLDDVVEPASERADAFADISAAERQEALARVLARLPEREREALVLHELEELSTSEVAAAMGTSEATVRSHVSHARAKARAIVQGMFRRRP